MDCAFGTGTPAVPANCSFAIATSLRKNSIEQGLPCVLLFTIAGFWVGGLVAYGGGRFEDSSSPLKCTGQCGAIHTVAFRASEARSLAPGLSVGRHDDQDTLIQGLAYQRAQWMRVKRVTRKPRTVPDPNNQAKR
jgi:hypothetical protein